MQQPGRVSEAALAVIASAQAILPTDRPPPPPHMSEPAAAEWRAIFERLGPDQLPRETHGLLETFCSVKASLDDLNTALRALGPGLPTEQVAWRRYQELTRLRGALVGQLCSLATKLRLSPQARYDRHRAGTAARRRPGRGLPPWALSDDDPMVG